MKLSKSTLYIVSTPIGNLDDITLRAINVLKKSDIVLCEDTRHSLKLLNHFNIKKKLISYHKFNESKRITDVIEYINQGKILSLISDAGTPLLSDPGKILINYCLEKGVNVVPVPGVSSVTAAMSITGFDDKFLFYGFLPKKNSELDKVLSSLSHCIYSQIFFIPAIKLNFYIEKFKTFFSDRKIMIAKEISKIHETFYRDEIKNLNFKDKQIKGELTVVISEKIKIEKKFDKEKIKKKIRKYFKTYSLKDTVAIISETENIKKRSIYDLCLQIKNETNS